MEFVAGTSEEAGMSPAGVERVRELTAGWVTFCSGWTPALGKLRVGPVAGAAVVVGATVVMVVALGS